MRIAHLLGSDAQGGAEGFYERLTVAQARDGDDVLAVLRADPVPGEGRAARLRAAGLDPVELPFGNPLDFATRLRLPAVLRRFAPDVVVAWQNRAAFFAPRGPWTLVGRLGGFYDLRYYRRCDHLVGNTAGLRAYFLGKGWAPGRAHHVPNFAADFAGAVPAALPVAPGRTRLLALGRLHENKGFDTLLDAMTRLPELHLFLAGDGPERGALERQARRLQVADRVSFLGWREDTGALLAACDLFVCPSRHEPLGNVVLEAWSAGKPVVAAASQGPGELIEDGANGRLVPVNDAASLAAALGALAADPAAAAALGAAGHARYRERFAAAPVLRQWRDFLESVAPRRHGERDAAAAPRTGADRNAAAPVGNPAGSPTGAPDGAPVGVPSAVPSGAPSGVPTGAPSGAMRVT